MHITLQGIEKTYDTPVLKGIDLDLEGYSTIAVIGKSGCGKSTLLRLLTGIEKPDNGSIVINEVPVHSENLKEYQKRIGIVFQQHNLFPHISLIKNISIILEKRYTFSRKASEEKARDLLIRLQLKDVLHKLPGYVSGGQAQRASIARALSTDPEIVFMDEPTAALDPLLTKEVLDAVLELREAGTQFVFVTHEISFVRKFAEYVLFLEDGGIVEQGNVSLLDNPQSAALKKFLKHERSV